MSLIYITGNAGAGKSTICAELNQRGYEAYDIDQNGITGWFDKTTGEQVEYPKNDEQRTKAWNDAHAFKMVRPRIERFSKEAEHKLIFLCGQSIHDEEVWDLFDHTIFLVVDKETLKHRLANREGNVFGKTSGELAAIMEVHDHFQEKHLRHGAIMINGLAPTRLIVDEILNDMQTGLDPRDIQQALKAARVRGFSGNYVALGGGEVNDTYKLDCGDRQLILRVARDEGQRTLENEAKALRLLDSPHIPKLVFFDTDNLIKDRLWILESYVPGTSKQRLTITQFSSLGNLLAQVHEVRSTESKVNLREQFLDNCKAFGSEKDLLDHPDSNLKNLIHKAFEEFEQKQPVYDHVTPTLIHLDATPSNILADGDDVGLIDWEFSKFSDPMSDFSTVYYEDIEYNQGKWRIRIRPDEKRALFQGYESAGGKIDEERIRFWIRFDKLGASVFLYWRLHQSRRIINQTQTEQYQLDFDNLITSLG